MEDLLTMFTERPVVFLSGMILEVRKSGILG
jgi:hypothetical protein